MMNNNRVESFRRRSPVIALAAFAVLLLWPLPAAGQGQPPVVRGDLGLKSGSQPPPGFYFTNVVYYYYPNTIKTDDGREVKILSIDQTFYGAAFTYVSKKKLLGGNYAASAVVPAFANAAIDTPLRDSRTGWAFADTYVQPIQLGWHFKRADVLTGYGLFIPTGRFSPGASNNTGLGMWSHELSLGATVYPDMKKKWSVATTASYNIQSHVKDTDRKVGNVLTLEGGVGRTVAGGLADVGLDYYAQWKVTRDKNFNLPAGFNDKHRMYGIGPEITGVIPLNPKTLTIWTLRYFVETGNRTATQGNSLVFSLTFARPHVGHEPPPEPTPTP